MLKHKLQWAPLRSATYSPKGTVFTQTWPKWKFLSIVNLQILPRRGSRCSNFSYENRSHMRLLFIQVQLVVRSTPDLKIRREASSRNLDLLSSISFLELLNWWVSLLLRGYLLATLLAILSSLDWRSLHNLPDDQQSVFQLHISLMKTFQDWKMILCELLSKRIPELYD